MRQLMQAQMQQLDGAELELRCGAATGLHTEGRFSQRGG